MHIRINIAKLGQQATSAKMHYSILLKIESTRIVQLPDLTKVINQAGLFKTTKSTLSLTVS
jgi:hypothetical protein